MSRAGFGQLRKEWEPETTAVTIVAANQPRQPVIQALDFLGGTGLTRDRPDSKLPEKIHIVQRMLDLISTFGCTSAS